MLRELNDISASMGLKVKFNKTKIMSSKDANIYMGRHNIECVDYFNYLGHIIRLGKENQYAESCQANKTGMGSFRRVRIHSKDHRYSNKPKTKVYITCPLPVKAYGLEMMCLTKAFANKLLTA